MDRPSLPASLLAATLFLGGAGSAVAQDGRMSDANLRASPAAELLARYDRNHDGKLDDEEKAVAKLDYAGRDSVGQGKVAKALRERAKRFDTDGDGRLDTTERAAAEKALRANIESHPKLLKRADTDHDGRLSDAEWQVAREAFRKRVKTSAASDRPAEP